jgi:hypothetical protein
VEPRSFIVRFFLVRDGRAVARVTDARSTRSWLIADPEALRALERAVCSPILATVADFGGAAGTAVLGRGYTTANAVVTGIVADCTVTLSGGTVTVAGGAYSQSYTFSGSASDTTRVIAAPTNRTQILVTPTGGRVFVTFDKFGFVIQASSLAPDGSSLTCPL